MTTFWPRLVVLLLVIFVLPIIVIRARPYDDLVRYALQNENCNAPCVMGIRPGVTSMSGAVYILESHPWVGNTADELPAPVRNAVFYGAGIYRFVLNWRWSGTQPAWIDPAVDGSVTVEDWDVLALRVDTHLRLGEIILAYDQPDTSVLFSGPVAGRYSYVAWYASEGLVVSAEGVCPIRRYYDLPVQLVLRPEPPNLPEAAPRTTVCS